MGWMFLGHLFEWWINPTYFSLIPLLHNLFDSIGAAGFLFISGVSIQLSFRKNMERMKNSNYTYNQMRNSYFFRTFLILIIALVYNASVAIAINNLSWIWTWFILFTISISLLVGWPLLRTKKWVRIIIGIAIWVINAYLFAFLTNFKAANNFYSVLYHLFYNQISQDPFLFFFPFFLFGTIIGDLLSEVYYNKNLNEEGLMKNKVILPLFLTSLILIVFGILIYFPNFFLRGSFSWLFYSLGIEILFFSILLYFEDLKSIKLKKSYKFLFYYSYYSFTVYLGHNLLFFLFFESLNFVTIWIAVSLTFIIVGLILKMLYRYLEGKASLKVQIGRLSSFLAKKLNQWKN